MPERNKSIENGGANNLRQNDTKSNYNSPDSISKPSPEKVRLAGPVKVPHFIGVGAERSATTWCWERLDEHPQICVSHPKELNYFHLNYNRGRQWYLSNFRQQDNQIVGEINPTYMYDQDARNRIASDSPDSTILAILRNPRERAISHLLIIYQNVYGAISEFDIDKATALAASRDKFIHRSLYYNALSEFYKIFDRNKIHILFYEDIQKDPASFAANLYSAVGADPTFSSKNLVEIVNKAQDYRSLSVFNAIRSVSKLMKTFPPSKFLVEMAGRAGLKEWTLNKMQVDRGRPQPEFDSIFGKTASQRIDRDINALKNDLGILPPEEWFL